MLNITRDLKLNNVSQISFQGYSAFFLSRHQLHFKWIFFHSSRNSVTLLHANDNNTPLLLENPDGYVAYSKATTVSVSSNTAHETFLVEQLKNKLSTILRVVVWICKMNYGHELFLFLILSTKISSLHLVSQVLSISQTLKHISM